jgi:hypothetical protein
MPGASHLPLPPAAARVGPWRAGGLASAGRRRPPPPAAPPSPPVAIRRSTRRLFYQLLIGEMELRGGRGRHRLRDGAGRRAPHAATRPVPPRRGHRAAGARRRPGAGRHPPGAGAARSLDALRTQVQILVALNRPGRGAEPLRRPAGPHAGRRAPGALIAALPRFLQRAPDRRRPPQLLEQALQPYRGRGHPAWPRAWPRAAPGWPPATPTARWPWRAQAQARDPRAPGPALLALELMRRAPQAEDLVTQTYLAPARRPSRRCAWPTCAC